MSSESPGVGDTFADVLNVLKAGSGRRRRHRKSTGDTPGPAVQGAPPGYPVEPAWSEPDVSPVDVSATRAVPVPPDAADQVAADLGISSDASIVRPYSWTRGRTKSTVELRIEAMVTTTEQGDDIGSLTHAEHRSVAELCREPRSVAEIATLLGVPLGVAKVLLGDMAGLGLVVVHKTATGDANKAHLLLMERVLSGLRRL